MLNGPRGADNAEYRVLDASRWPSEASYDGTRATAEPLRASLASQIFARMSGMLDLSREEKAKHRLPRWFSEAPTCLRHADEPLHLLERIVDLAVEEDLLRREGPVPHCVQDQLEPFLVPILVLVVSRLVGDLPPVRCLDPGKKGRNGGDRAAHGDEGAHNANVHVYGDRGTQHAAEHRNAALREGIGHILQVFAAFHV